MKLSVFEAALKRGTTIKKASDVQYCVCTGQSLKSLADANLPDRVVRHFNCSDNELTDLKGGPSHVGGVYQCNRNKISSLEGAPPSCERFECTNNKLVSLKDVHKHLQQVKRVNFSNNPLESHVLGLLKIKGLTEVYLTNHGSSELHTIENIINKHLAGDRNILACQEELIDVGFEEFAQL